MDLLVLDPHSIYRRGLIACLGGMEDVGEIHEADVPSEALERPGIDRVDVVIVDPDVVGGYEFIRKVRETSAASVVVCSSRCEEQDVLEAVQVGAVRYLCKETLTPETLAIGIRAAASGAGVMTPELLGSLLRGIARVSRDVLEPRGLSLSRLTPREQQVLRLVADGHPTREVAEQLCYSERTIKNVFHDAVMKLNAHTRSQAVAEAVREGLI